MYGSLVINSFSYAELFEMVFFNFGTILFFYWTSVIRYIDWIAKGLLTLFLFLPYSGIKLVSTFNKLAAFFEHSYDYFAKAIAFWAYYDACFAN